MLFQEVLIEKIVRDKKTQTRRPVKKGEIVAGDGSVVMVAVKDKLRDKIAVGRDYAVQSGRGKPCVLWIPSTGELRYPGDIGYAEMVAARKHIGLDTVFAPPGEGFEFLRIRVLSIRREDVRKISHNDAVAEGFSGGRMGFWKTWCGFYDPRILDLLNAEAYDSDARALLNKRPDDRYQAWAYTFEVVR